MLMTKILHAALLSLFLAPIAIAADGPRTGYFQVSLTPIELLGEEGASAVSSLFPPDKELTWQLSVPENYDPEKPAGVFVHIGWSESWGGGKKTWVQTYEEQNLIWIGVIGGGDKKSVNERMLRALLAKAVLERDYKIDVDRYYLYGTASGAHIAAMLATSRPELFKGAIYYAGGLFWGKATPPKIDLVRENHYVFMAGALDDDIRRFRRAADDYKKAGVINTLFLTVANTVRKTPGVSYFEEAVRYLDARSAAPESAE